MNSRAGWIRAGLSAFVLFGWGGAVSIGADAPKTISETRYYKDVSAYFYKTLPFLKKGFRFLDGSLSAVAKEGSVSSLLIDRADGPPSPDLSAAQPVRTTKEFVRVIDAIRSEKEAMTYVLFLSRKGFPWMEPIAFDYFQDVPFTALEFVHVSSSALAANSIRPPRVSVEKGYFFQKKRFTIVRTVVPLDQPSLQKEKILSGKSPLELTEVAEATETVMEDGAYSYSLRRIPVKTFPIENPLKALRKPK